MTCDWWVCSQSFLNLNEANQSLIRNNHNRQTLVRYSIYIRTYKKRMLRLQRTKFSSNTIYELWLSSTFSKFNYKLICLYLARSRRRVLISRLRSLVMIDLSITLFNSKLVMGISKRDQSFPVKIAFYSDESSTRSIFWLCR